MLFLPMYRIVACAASLSFATALPANDHSRLSSLQSRQATICFDLDGGLTSSCWNELRIDEYLDQWNKSTPFCTAIKGDGSDCCTTSEPWATCFLRLAVGPYADCSELNGRGCSLDVTGRLRPDVAPSIAPQVRYVVETMRIINNLFGSYSIGRINCPTIPQSHLKLIFITSSSASAFRCRISGNQS